MAWGCLQLGGHVGEFAGSLKVGGLPAALRPDPADTGFTHLFLSVAGGREQRLPVMDAFKATNVVVQEAANGASNAPRVRSGSGLLSIEDAGAVEATTGWIQGGGPARFARSGQLQGMGLLASGGATLQIDRLAGFAAGWADCAGVAPLLGVALAAAFQRSEGAGPSPADAVFKAAAAAGDSVLVQLQQARDTVTSHRHKWRRWRTRLPR